MHFCHPIAANPLTHALYVPAVFMQDTSMYTCILARVCMCVCMCAYVYVCACVCACLYMHIYIYVLIICRYKQMRGYAYTSI